MPTPPHDSTLRPIATYLERYGETIAAVDNTDVTHLLTGSYRWVLVVPAFDEAPDFLDTLLQNINFATQQKALLVVCVINAPSDAPADARERTLAGLFDSDEQAAEPAPPSLRVHIDKDQSRHTGIDVLTIDAATEPLPADQATGLARKIGNDIACQLMLSGHIKTLLLCNTDADAILPSDYFRQLAAASASAAQRGALNTRPHKPGAFILPFTHHSDQPELHAAGQLYELYLRSLYTNLEASGSPYAYPALGSVMAIDAVLYAKTRGFPKRRAGEDFYLLNKIAKLADVLYLAGNPVVLQARVSARVPFGTGPAIDKTLKEMRELKVQQQSAATYLSYAPASFALLKRFYDGFKELGRRVDARPSVRGPYWPAAWQDPDLLWLLKRLGLPTVLKKLQSNHPTAKAQRRAVHEWFDALKIVRFLNEARHFHVDEPLLLDPNETAAELNAELERTRLTTCHGVAREP